MKKSLLLILVVILTVSLQAQKDTINYFGTASQQDVSRSASAINLTIFPVPVRENSFTIRTDRNISFVRVTNIIGQDIYRAKYNNPEQLIRIILDNPKRGMYLVTITFGDGNRVVKKILIEESE
jgi:hypothetical protein